MKQTPLRRAPYYLPLLALYPLYFLYAVNARDVQLYQVLASAAVMLGLTAAIFLITFSLHSLQLRTADDEEPMRERIEAAALVTTVFLIAFYTFDFVRQAVEFVVRIDISQVPLVGAVVVLAFAINLWILATPSRALRVTRPFNVFVLALYVMTTIRLAPALLRPNEVKEYAEGIHPFTNGTVRPKTPDVYFIILDAYPAAHVIKDYFGYDNSTFLNALRVSNFTVNDSARSNYSLTFMSLSATLNGRLMNDRVAHLGTERSTELPYALIRRNAVIPFMKSMGYRTYTVNSGWGPTAHSPVADVNLDCAGLAEFEDLFLRPTALWPFLAKKQSDYESRLCTLRKLAAVALKPGPKFVFAHILMPHPPFVVSAKGEAMNNGQALRDLTSWDNKAAFLQQLQYLNGRVLTIVHRIQSSSPVPPIIIIQGDHGSANTGHWIAPSPRLMAERMTILDAVSAPGFALTADSIETSVNTFPILFNKLFGTTTQRMPDGSWFSAYEHPYVFTRVDSIVRAGSMDRGPVSRIPHPAGTVAPPPAGPNPQSR